MLPASAYITGAGARQSAIARSASSGVPPVVMSPPMTSRSMSPMPASASGTRSYAPWMSTMYPILMAQKASSPAKISDTERVANMASTVPASSGAINSSVSLGVGAQSTAEPAGELDPWRKSIA